jgi:hypothetical protein
MRFNAVLTVAAAIAVASPGIAAQEVTNGAQKPSVVTITPGAKWFAGTAAENPFTSRVEKRQSPQPTSKLAGPSPLPSRGSSEPQVFCGLTVVPADASLDRGLLHYAPENAGKFAMRFVEPPACHR